MKAKYMPRKTKVAWVYQCFYAFHWWISKISLWTTLFTISFRN